MTLERLKRVLDNANKLGWNDARVIGYLSATADMDATTRRTQGQIVHLQQERTREEGSLRQVRAESARVSAALATTNEELRKAEDRLIPVLERIKVESARLEFADAVRLLLLDPLQLTAFQLHELVSMLQTIRNAKLDPNQIMQQLSYPTDYGAIREKALALLEPAFGKRLIPREKDDEMLRRYVEPHDDRMFNELWRIEQEHNKLAKWKEEIAEMTVEKALLLTVDLQERGIVKVYRCRSCGSVTSYAPSPQASSLGRTATCPGCGTPLVAGP